LSAISLNSGIPSPPKLGEREREQFPFCHVWLNTNSYSSCMWWHRPKRFKCLLISGIVHMQKFSLCLYLAVKHVYASWGANLAISDSDDISFIQSSIFLLTKLSR